jgi:hypothetical protein
MSCYGQSSVDDEFVVGRGLAALDELPRPTAHRRVVADEEEAVLAVMALEDHERRDDRDDPIDAGR